MSMFELVQIVVLVAFCALLAWDSRRTSKLKQAAVDKIASLSGALELERQSAKLFKGLADSRKEQIAVYEAELEAQAESIKRFERVLDGDATKWAERMTQKHRSDLAEAYAADLPKTKEGIATAFELADEWIAKMNGGKA